jgi:hypothetical protein
MRTKELLTELTWQDLQDEGFTRRQRAMIEARTTDYFTAMMDYSLKFGSQVQLPTGGIAEGQIQGPDYSLMADICAVCLEHGQPFEKVDAKTLVDELVTGGHEAGEVDFLPDAQRCFVGILAKRPEEEV